MTEDDSFDYVTSWHIVSMITLSLYMQLLKNYLFSYNKFEIDNHIDDDRNDNINNNNNNDNNNYYNSSSNDDTDKNKNKNKNENKNEIIDRRNTYNSSMQNKNKNRRNSSNSKSSTFILKTLKSFYELLQCVLEVLNVRVRYTNSKKLCDYLSSISSLVLLSSNLCGESAIFTELNTKSTDTKDIYKIKETCSILFVFAAKIVRDLGT